MEKESYGLLFTNESRSDSMWKEIFFFWEAYRVGNYIYIFFRKKNIYLLLCWPLKTKRVIDHWKKALPSGKREKEGCIIYLFIYACMSNWAWLTKCIIDLTTDQTNLSTRLLQLFQIWKKIWVMLETHKNA